MKKNERSEAGLYFGKTAVRIPAVLYGAVITAFLQQSGFTGTQIGTIWSLILLTTTIVDVPTGGFADQYGRLKIYSLGMIMMGISKIILSLQHGNMFIACFAAVMAGLGESQISGTISPWYVQNAGSDNPERIQRAFANAQVISNTVGIAFGIIIAVLPFSYRSILQTAGIIQCSCAVIMRVCFPDKRGGNGTVLMITGNAVRVYLHNRKLWIYTLLMICM